LFFEPLQNSASAGVILSSFQLTFWTPWLQKRTRKAPKIIRNMDAWLLPHRQQFLARASFEMSPKAKKQERMTGKLKRASRDSQ
jgi:hypothetical protein